MPRFKEAYSGTAWVWVYLPVSRRELSDGIPGISGPAASVTTPSARAAKEASTSREAFFFLSTHPAAVVAAMVCLIAAPSFRTYRIRNDCCRHMKAF